MQRFLVLHPENPAGFLRRLSVTLIPLARTDLPSNRCSESARKLILVRLLTINMQNAETVSRNAEF